MSKKLIIDFAPATLPSNHLRGKCVLIVSRLYADVL